MTKIIMDFFKSELKFLTKFMPTLISELSELTDELDQEDFESISWGIEQDIKALFLEGDLSENTFLTFNAQISSLNKRIKECRMYEIGLIIKSIIMQIKAIIAIDYGFTNEFSFDIYKL